MMKPTLMLFLLFTASAFPVIAQHFPKPTKQQLDWQRMETTAFIHFTVNTFTGKEWGDGTESPAIFNPQNFDAEKMIKTLKETGFKIAIITAKHHDGFCLWPTSFTEHSIKHSPWKKGKGDVVKEIEAACRKYGIKFGFYLSPWDQHNPSYGTTGYNTFYKNQLKELLTSYGDVAEVWFDGAKGENAKDMTYDFPGYFEMIRKYQPNAVVFSGSGLSDIRWVGNEDGNAGETCWSTINTVGPEPGDIDHTKFNTGDPDGKLWIPAETDVSIRPGWFYHSEEDGKVKSGKEIVDLYYKSVGRNSLLLLNIPPNKEGLFSEIDVKSLYDYRSILDETFKANLAKEDVPKSLTDNDLNTFVIVKDNQPLVLSFKKKLSFDRVSLQENITNGQRNEEALLEFWDGKNWKVISRFTTIGYKRLLRFPQVSATKVRLTVLKSKQPVQIAEIGLYKASSREH